MRTVLFLLALVAAFFCFFLGVFIGIEYAFDSHAFIWMGTSIPLFIFAAVARKKKIDTSSSAAPTQPEDVKPEALEVQESEPEKTITVPPQIDGMALAYHYKDVKIAVIRGAEPDFNAISPGDVVTLIQEPTNEYDNNAVAVMANGVKLGYLFRGRLQDMANDFLNSERAIFSCITAIDSNEHVIEIFLGFYQNDNGKYIVTVVLPIHKTKE